MFWGNGDSSKLTPDEKETLQQLQRLVETGHVVALSPEQSKVALDAIRFYGAVTATTGVLVGARNVAWWIAGLAVAVWAAPDAVKSFIQAIAAGVK